MVGKIFPWKLKSIVFEVIMNPKWHEQAKAFYQHIMNEYTLSLDEQSVLQGAAAQLSLYWEATAILEMEGLTVTSDNGMARKHPACEITKNCWAGFLAGCRLLGVCQPEATRPGRPLGSWYGTITKTKN
jgi:hypothetical protein